MEKIEQTMFEYCENANEHSELYDAFCAGAEWQKQQFESEESRTERNMNLISSFAEHYKNEMGKDIPENITLSFFNA